MSDWLLPPVSNAEHNTIMAALRYYQEKGQGEPSNRSDAIHDLATGGDEDISLNDEGIDDLCERLNCCSLEICSQNPAFVAGGDSFWSETPES